MWNIVCMRLGVQGCLGNKKIEDTKVDLDSNKNNNKYKKEA